MSGILNSRDERNRINILEQENSELIAHLSINKIIIYN